MTDVDEFIEHFFNEHGDDNILEHAEIKRRYDPVKARAYYLRTRKLKGRKKGITDPRSKIGYNGKPLKPLGQRIEEDETPETSPSGAKLKDYTKGSGLGRGVYADGSIYDAKTGWSTPGISPKAPSRAARISSAQDKIRRAKVLADKVKGPKGDQLRKRLAETQKKLDRTRATANRGR